MASTSTSARASQSMTRSSRVRIEFTFQVASRKCGDRMGGEAGRSGSPPSIVPSGMARDYPASRCRAEKGCADGAAGNPGSAARAIASVSRSPTRIQARVSPRASARAASAPASGPQLGGVGERHVAHQHALHAFGGQSGRHRQQAVGDEPAAVSGRAPHTRRRSPGWNRSEPKYPVALPNSILVRHPARPGAASRPAMPAQHLATPSRPHARVRGSRRCAPARRSAPAAPPRRRARTRRRRRSSSAPAPPDRRPAGGPPRRSAAGPTPAAPVPDRHPGSELRPRDHQWPNGSGPSPGIHDSPGTPQPCDLTARLAARACRPIRRSR